LKLLSKEFINEYIKENKIELKSTHGKLCLPIINRIYKKMLVGIKFPKIKIDTDLIIDGHHRYLASLLANTDLDTIPSSKTSATLVYDWNDVIFDINDWDTEAKIRMLNEHDADNNNITLKEIIELLK